MSDLIIVVVALLAAALGPPLNAGEALVFQNDSPGLESRPLEERTRRSPGQTLFETREPAEIGISPDGPMPDVSRHFRQLTALGGYFGLCTADIDNDGLPDLFVTNPTGENHLYRNQGGFKFEDVTEQAGLTRKLPWSTGASFADVDNDGRLDLFICGFRRPNRLYMNEGVGEDGVPRFVERAKEFGLNQNRASMNMAFADFDNDGDLDAYLATTYAPPPRGVEFRVKYVENRPVVVDELSEYWELIYLPGDRAHLTDSGQFDHLFRNDGDGFTDITDEAGIEGAGSTLGVVWWDANSDGLPDVYAANDFYAPDKLYLNQGNGTFKEVAGETVPHTPWSSMGCDFGDLNNDGLLDLIATDMLGTTHYRRNVMLGEISQREWFLEYGRPRQYARNAVYLNTGTRRMMEIAYLTGMAATDWTWGPRIEDYDNDGRQDVLFTNGMIRDVQHADYVNYANQTFGESTPGWSKFWSEQAARAEKNLAFRNLGNLQFEDVSADWGFDQDGVSYGAATADFDNDGDLDVVINNAGEPVSVLENQSGSGNAIRVELRGRTSNRYGVGATIRLKADGLQQVRYVAITHGWQSGGEMVSHFGIGESDRVDSLVVSWPGGRRQEFTDLRVNRLYRVTEPMEDATDSDFQQSLVGLYSKSDWAIDVKQVAPSFDELTLQPLLPKRISQASLAMAWGDVDLDGDDDLFVGGGNGQVGRIFAHQDDGTFSELTVAALDAGKMTPDTDALFFDSDLDGDQDLLVVNGAASDASAVTEMVELFLNDGRGGFSRAFDRVPSIAEPVNCVAAADFDSDGDKDLFVGAGTTIADYPLVGRSRLLINDEGSFEDVTPESFAHIGLATDALWTDVTGDGHLDLLVTTDWGPVKLFINRDATLIESKTTGIEQLTGWWNAIAAGDIDGDSDIDLVVGNVGLNTQYVATTSHPASLYRGDFAGTGQPILVETYFEQGRQYPVRGFDQLSRAIPDLRRRFLNFHEFSSATVEQMFSESTLAAARRFQANTFESGVLRNDGSGRFTFEPLPRIAQNSPINDLILLDINQDSHLDLVVAQNDFSIAPVMGRFDGGLGFVLLGDGVGSFRPVMPAQSGVVCPESARRIAVPDLNGDGKPDLVLGTIDGEFHSFIRR